MAYYNKYYYRRVEGIPYTNYYDDGRVYHGVATLNNYCFGSADWSRPKPSPLSVTKLVITKHYEDTSPIVKRNNGYTYTGPYSYSGDLSTYDSFETPVTDASQKALSNFYNGQVNLAVFLGEARESSHMIVSKFMKIKGLFSNLENLNFKSLSQQGIHIHPRKQKELKSIKRSKRVANAYLELKYGWLPLISDVYQMCDALRSSFKDVGVSVRSHGRSSSKNEFGVYSKVSLRGQVSNTATRSLTEMGFSNPLLIAWELVPFSFVIDYFLGIGNTLASFPIFSGTTFTEGTATTVKVSSYRSKRTGEIMKQDTYISRLPITLSSVERNAVNFGFKNSLSVSYSTAATLISLGFQRYK